MDTSIFKPVTVEQEKNDVWQTQEEIRNDAEWCVQSRFAKTHQKFPAPGLTYSILESALSWALV